MEFYNEKKKKTDIKTQDDKIDIKENEEEIKKDEQIEEKNLKYKNIISKKVLILTFVIITILIISILCCTIFALLNINNTKIIKGVTINKINIGKLTKEEATKLIKDRMQEYIEKDINIKSSDFEYSIKLSQIGVEYKIEEAIEKAYNVGRDGNIFSNNFRIIKSMINGENIELEYSYNDELFNNIINDINAKIPDAVVEANYYIENDNLYIAKGKAGNTIDKEKLKNEIINKIKKENYDEIILEVYQIEPQTIDIEKIYNEVHKEPKNAYYTKNPFQIFPHENGIDFDIEEAKKLLEEDKDEYMIKIKITEPDITTSEIGTEAFPDLLSTFSTNYDTSNIPRTTNLKLAMQKLNGVVVNPGETFSYNKTLGKRTAEAGYKEAGGYAGGKVVQTLAGGICQISSTLYDAVVYANLDIVERHNHMFLAGYVGAGKDATVVYGSLDFKFKNTRKYPIMIKTSIGGGTAKISIFGIKEEVEYDVEISTKILGYTTYKVIYEDDNSLTSGKEKVVQGGMNGCKSITYKILRLNGKEISKEVLSSDTYDPMNKIIKRGPKETVQTNVLPQQNTETAPKTEGTTTQPPTTNTTPEKVPEESSPEESKPEENMQEQTPNTESENVQQNN